MSLANLSRQIAKRSTTPQALRTSVAAMSSGNAGSGSGKGGGSGGSIRDAGGAFGEREAARENEYFYKKQKEQLDKLRSHLGDEIAANEKLIKDLEKSVATAKAHQKELEKGSK